MTCPEVVSRLDDLVDGDLPPDEGNRLRDHIRTCEDCRREYDLTRRVKTLLESATTPNPGDEYFAESESHILARTVEADQANTQESPAKGNERSPHRTALLRAVLSVAASLAILFIAIYLGSNQEMLISRTVDRTAPVIATANVRESVGNNPVFTREERTRITQGMMLIGGPGFLGRFSALPEILKTNLDDET